MYEELVSLLRKKYDKAPMVMEAADAMAELSKHRWIPVTEQLPEPIHEYVLCCGEKGGQFVGWIAEGMIMNGKARAFQHGGKGRYITHWMPLPKPPQSPKEDTP